MEKPPSCRRSRKVSATCAVPVLPVLRGSVASAGRLTGGGECRGREASCSICRASVAHASERRRKLAPVFGSVAASAAPKCSAAFPRQFSAVIITSHRIHRALMCHRSQTKKSPAHVRRGLRARQSSKNSMCDEFVDDPDYDDSRYNEHPIGNLNASYRCLPAKPVHGFPPR